MIDTQQLQSIGNQVAKQIEGKYLSLTIQFSASPVTGEDKTFAEVLISSKDGNTEKLFKVGVIDHPTAPNAFRFQQVFKKYFDGYARQFLELDNLP